MTINVPWWSYKVKKGDENYDRRHDKKNDFFELDYDQTTAIEKFYQECCQGISNFGDKTPIVGDENMKKNGFIYEVWGQNRDPSTWYEKNTQFNNPRQLKREIKSMSFERK